MGVTKREMIRRLRERIRDLQGEIEELQKLADDLETDLCPHPLDRRTVKAADTMFKSREGCLDCNEWLGPVSLWRE